MIPQIPDKDYRKVIEAAKAGNDPLGIGDGSNGTEIAQAQAAIEAVHAALDGMDAETAERVIASMLLLEGGGTRSIGNPQGLPSLDRITVELLAYMNVDPLAVAWLSLLCQGIRIIDADTDAEMADIDGHLPPTDDMTDTTVTLSQDIVWRATGKLIVHGMPDSMALTAVGRPLREVVSHPVLDRHPFTVVEVETGSDMASPCLITNIRHHLPSIQELAGIAPAGCR